MIILAGVDYTVGPFTPTTIVFTPGESTFHIPFTIIDDLIAESNETFSLNLFNTATYRIAPFNTATVNIINDDGM